MAMAWDLMVIPFSRSRSMLSRTWSFILDLGIVCVTSRRRSARVDFPWSMWAMMQKLRTRSRGCMDSGLEVGAQRDREARPGLRCGRVVRGPEVGVKRHEMRVHVGIHHLEQVG